MKKILISLGIVVVLAFIPYIGILASGSLKFLFGVFIPLVAVIVFLVGVIRRVVIWGRSAVPFRIPTTCGQQESLSWIKQNKIDNPSSGFWVMVRMFFEVFLFRSLFRNTKAELRDGGKRLSYGESKWLWIMSLVFHFSLFVVIIRHLRFFLEPVPFFVNAASYVDSVLQIGMPILYLSGVALLGTVSFLFLRRVVLPKIRYISLTIDYFPLLLILFIVCTGLLMRYFTKVDILSIKELVINVMTFSFSVSVFKGIDTLFFVHIFLVSILIAYFPFSQLMHGIGIFFSPTRNMANNNRKKRHINPWNYPVKLHTYEQYEDDFRETMKKAGLPVEKE